ncbi:MAG: site-specific DNA-methyltransferase [Chlorobi bacterium]|nr:site-specific DNA-methyltransferase [Chlorobiota bacterium]
MTTRHTIIIGDSRKMQDVPDESVHLIVTSPPYWQLKDYGCENQIGFHDSYEDYINHLNLVWKECYRVLHPGCRLCINIGDQFARSVYYGRYKVIPIRTEIIRFCETLGMDYMGAIIWQKVTTMNTTGGASIMGSFPYPRNGIIKLDYEFILIFKKLGIPPKVSVDVKERSKLTPEEWNTYFAGHWQFNGEKQDKHIAMFPEELPRRLIRMFSFIGETVLDPFLGSGTTSLAAKNLGRNSIGYEINSEFLPIIRHKLGVGNSSMFDDATVEFVSRLDVDIDFEEEIARLPYRFRDPHRLDKKVDPRALPFGSTITANANKGTEDLFRVTAVLSPSKILLDTGVVVRLIGISDVVPDPSNAMKFLCELTKGKRVFLRFDRDKYDNEGNLLAYVHLKNRTFVNAHLIRTGYVAVDCSRSYALRDKFLQLTPIPNNSSGT